MVVVHRRLTMGDEAVKGDHRPPAAQCRLRRRLPSLEAIADLLMAAGETSATAMLDLAPLSLSTSACWAARRFLGQQRFDAE